MVLSLPYVNISVFFYIYIVNLFRRCFWFIWFPIVCSISPIFGLVVLIFFVVSTLFIGLLGSAFPFF